MRALQNMTEIKKMGPTYLPRQGDEGWIKNLFGEREEGRFYLNSPGVWYHFAAPLSRLNPDLDKPTRLLVPGSEYQDPVAVIYLY